MHRVTPAEIAALPYRPCVGIVLAREGRVFAGQRIDRDVEAWQMPQGGIDPGESPRDAALRELAEETGIPAAAVEIVAERPGVLTYDLPADLVPRIWHGRYRGQAQHWFLMRYLGRDEDIDIALPHAEFSAWSWREPDALVAGIVPFKRAVYAVVIDGFRGELAR